MSDFSMDDAILGRVARQWVLADADLATALKRIQELELELASLKQEKPEK